jgi:hypothetical protein
MPIRTLMLAAGLLCSVATNVAEARTPRAVLPGHLLVGDVRFGTGTLTALPLTNGIPSTKADLEIPGLQAWNVGTDGNVYGTFADYGHPVGRFLVAYPAHSSQPTFQHRVDAPLVAMAENNGIIYGMFGSSFSIWDHSLPCDLTQGVAGYHIDGDPWDDGCASITLVPAGGAIAVDTAGDLYAADPFNAAGARIDVFSAPPHMHVLRTITGPTTRRPRAVALDGAGHLLTVDQGKDGSFYVAVYPASANGTTRALRAIEPIGSAAPGSATWRPTVISPTSARSGASWYSARMRASGRSRLRPSHRRSKTRTCNWGPS